MSLDQNSGSASSKDAAANNLELIKNPEVSRRRVNWIPNSSEKETYRTVVVNYHYAKADRFRRSIASIPKKRNTWSKMLSKMAAKRALQEAEEEEEAVALKTVDKNKVPSLDKIVMVSEEKLKDIRSGSIPNLKKFFEISKEDLLKASKDNLIKESKSESIYNLRMLYELSRDELLSASKSESAKGGILTKRSLIRDKFLDKDNENKQIKVEVYRFPTKQINMVGNEISCLPGKIKSHTGNSKTELPRRPIFIDPEVIIISDDEDSEDKPAKPEAIKYEQANCQTEPQNQTDQGSQVDSYIIPIPIKARNSKEIITEKALQKSQSTSSQKLNTKASTSGSSNLRQRQAELHRHRVAVELKRLELLEVKLVRERDELMRERILFEKDLELRTSQLIQLKSDLENLKIY